MGLVQIRREIDISGSDELAEFLVINIAVHEHDIPFHTEFLGELFEGFPVAFAVVPNLIRVRGSEDDVNDIRLFADDFRQGPQGILDPLARRKKPEGQKHWTPCHAKVVLVKIRIRKRDVRYAVRDDGNFIRRDPMDVAQHFSPVIRHDHNFSGTFDKL